MSGTNFYGLFLLFNNIIFHSAQTTAISCSTINFRPPVSCRGIVFNKMFEYAQEILIRKKRKNLFRMKNIMYGLHSYTLWDWNERNKQTQIEIGDL